MALFDASPIFMQYAQNTAQNNQNTVNALSNALQVAEARKVRQQQMELEKQKLALEASQLAQDPNTGQLYPKYMGALGGGFGMPQTPQGGFDVSAVLNRQPQSTMPATPAYGGSVPAGMTPKQQAEYRGEYAKKAAETEEKKAEERITNEAAINSVRTLRDLNAGSFEMPFSENLLPVLRANPLADESYKRKLVNTDLMRQARLEMAAPLAKQLGVNPTDKDFQATLDRVFDLNASKQSREAQINALEKKLVNRQSRIGGAVPQQDAPMDGGLSSMSDEALMEAIKNAK